MAPNGSVLHEFEEAGLGDLVLIEDIEELEYKQQVVLLLLIHERLDRVVIVGQVHHDLEVVLEARR